jgi:hypothetical protein
MNTRDNLPIACSLTVEERPARRAMLSRIGEAIREAQERANGYAYRFASDDILEALIEIVKAERHCCPFLHFALSFEPGNGPLWLEITGPAGTKEFLSEFFR